MNSAGTLPTRHIGVVCKWCGENEFEGIRWKCVEEYEYDLCDKWYKNSINEDRVFVQILFPI